LDEAVEALRIRCSISQLATHASQTSAMTASAVTNASSARRGRHRWVGERALSGLLGCRRLGMRDERRADLLRGRLPVAGALMGCRILTPAPDSCR